MRNGKKDGINGCNRIEKEIWIETKKKLKGTRIFIAIDLTWNEKRRRDNVVKMTKLLREQRKQVNHRELQSSNRRKGNMNLE